MGAGQIFAVMHFINEAEKEDKKAKAKKKRKQRELEKMRRYSRMYPDDPEEQHAANGLRRGGRNRRR